MAQSNDIIDLSDLIYQRLIKNYRDLGQADEKFTHQIAEAVSKLVIGNQNQQHDGVIELLEAIQSQNENLVSDLLQNKGINPNSPLPTGQYPIHFAVQLREKACAMIIALSSSSEHPLDLNVKNEEGNTAMHIASTLASEDTVSLLLEKNADPNIQNLDGNTPLLIAVKLKAPKLARKLLQDARTDISLKDKTGKAANQIDDTDPEIKRDITTACLKKNDAALGELEMALSWNNFNDLDIHVTCPHGQVIFYNHKVSTCCNGTLDIDMNAGGQKSEQPVEHIYWKKNPPKGKYIVKVHHFAVHTSPPIVPTKFNFRMTVNEMIIWEKEATAHKEKETVEVISFTYPDDTRLDSSNKCKLNYSHGQNGS